MCQIWICEVPETERCESRFHIETTERGAKAFCRNFTRWNEGASEPTVTVGSFATLSELLRAQQPFVDATAERY